MTFSSGYKLIQKVSKWKPSEKEKLHQFWFDQISGRWQEYMQNYYNSHMRVFSMDQLGCVGAKQSAYDFNFLRSINTDVQYNTESFVWSINDDVLHEMFVILGFNEDDDFRIRSESADLQVAFENIVNEYTDNKILNDYNMFKGGK